MKYGITLLTNNGSAGMWLTRRGDYGYRPQARTWKKQGKPLFQELKKQRKLFPDSAHAIIIYPILEKGDRRPLCQ